MKLTKKKLEQLIIEAYTRRVSDENKPINYPEYADKLTKHAKDDYTQARSLADALDEPLTIELGSGETETIPFKDDRYRVSKFRKWMVSKGYGPQIRRTLRKPNAKQIFKEFTDETKDYLTHNTVVAAFRADHIQFLDEETGTPLPLGSSRPFNRTALYEHPRP